MGEFRIETARLFLREWRAEDVDDFLAVNSDPEVMATLGPLMDRSEVTALIERMQRTQAEQGHCLWAMERKEGARVIGWCGAIVGKTGPIEGKLEIGWRMARDCWGQGLVNEGASATMDWLFDNRPDDSVWAITSKGNRRSRSVMERLGMRYRPDCDFAHPGFPADHALSAHVTYAIGRDDWNPA